MRYKNRSLSSFNHLFSNFIEFGCIFYHCLANAGQLRDSGRNIGLRIYQTTPAIQNPLTIMQNNSNLRNPMPGGTTTCGFYINYCIFFLLRHLSTKYLLNSKIQNSKRCIQNETYPCKYKNFCFTFCFWTF